MTPAGLVTIVRHDGRRMLASVKWWLQMGGRSPSQLRCIHNEPLDKHCRDCEES